MKTYTVQYKLKGQWFWRRIRHVKGDEFVNGGRALLVITENEERFDVPTEGTRFYFERARYENILGRMSKEAGQPVQVGQG